MSGLSLRDRVESSDIQDGFRVELLLQHIERNQLRWFKDLVKMPLEHLEGEVFRVCSVQTKTWGRHQARTSWRDYISHQAWEYLSILSLELVEVARERVTWASLLKLLPQRPGPG